MAKLRDTENAHVETDQRGEGVLGAESLTLTRPLLDARALTLTSLPLAADEGRAFLAAEVTPPS